MNARSQYYTRMMQSAAMTPNEIREKEGMVPYDGGDRYFMATNNFSPVDKIDEIIDAQIAKKEGNPSTQVDQKGNVSPLVRKKPKNQKKK